MVVWCPSNRGNVLEWYTPPYQWGLWRVVGRVLRVVWSRWFNTNKTLVSSFLRAWFLGGLRTIRDLFDSTIVGVVRAQLGVSFWDWNERFERFLRLAYLHSLLFLRRKPVFTRECRFCLLFWLSTPIRYIIILFFIKNINLINNKKGLYIGVIRRSGVLGSIITTDLTMLTSQNLRIGAQRRPEATRGQR